MKDLLVVQRDLTNGTCSGDHTRKGSCGYGGEPFFEEAATGAETRENSDDAKKPTTGFQEMRLGS